MTPQDMRSTARRRRALESEQGPSVGFQVLALVGIAAFGTCLVLLIGSVAYWVAQGLGAVQ